MTRVRAYMSQKSLVRLEREAGRNVEVMWLTGRLVTDHKTIADFRKDNGQAIRKVRARFIMLCRALGLFGKVSVAIDGPRDSPRLGGRSVCTWKRTASHAAQRSRAGALA